MRRSLEARKARKSMDEQQAARPILVSGEAGGSPVAPNDSAAEATTSTSASRSASSDLARGRHEDVAVDMGSPTGILEPVPDERRVVVVVDGVSAWVPAFIASPSLLESLSKMLFLDVAFKKVKSAVGGSRNAPGKGQPEGVKVDRSGQPMKQILFNINVSCQPGEVLALMGPSGGGKTSLLSIMGGRKATSVETKGKVQFNDQELSKEKKRRVGFVLQDDLLYETLTVWETLYFAAMLRLPKSMSKAQKVERVQAVVTALGLDKCKDTIIGGFFRRGVSGGERKRVSVGHELLINPSVLLLDEPTSGLDSTTAMHLLVTLRELAAGGRAVITTIHQPSSRLYQQLDSLLLLSMGRAMFYGEAAKASEWFEQLGVRQPFGVNTADFILDCASGDVAAPKRSVGEESRTFLVEESERYLLERPDGMRSGKRGEAGDLHDGEGKSGGLPSSSGGPSQPSLAAQLSARVSAKLSRANTWARELTVVKDRWGATYPRQLQVLFTRAVKVRRFESMSVQDFTQFLVVGFVCGMLWWQRGNSLTLQGAQDVTGLLFFEGLFLSFRIMFSALFTFPSEFKMMLKERASGMYRLSAFYFARTASDLPMDWTIPTLFVIITYWMAWLRPTVGAFFANWSTVMLLQMVAQSFGLLIGASVMFPKTAQTIAAVIMLTFMLIGGYYVRAVPAWIDWLKYLSFMWYGNNILLKVQFGGQTYYDCGTVNPADPSADSACSALTADELTEELNLQRPVNEWAWEALVLIGYLLILRVLVYITLRRKTSSV